MAELLRAINSVTDVRQGCLALTILDSTSDIDHNRSVITFAGKPEAVIEAAFKVCQKAAELIDLDQHHGTHPRIGATDVIPLVPIEGITFDETVILANKLGARIGEELKIPVYLYEKAAKFADRRNLADVRKGQYEGLKTLIATDPNRKPDYGPLEISKAGATAIGVRGPLIAYNINLASSDLAIARKIAHKIREKDGGLKCVKALGMLLTSRSIATILSEIPHDISNRIPNGIAQISMNLTDYTVTPPLVVFETVELEARKLGVEILESELIGLIPAAALPSDYKQKLKIKNLDDQILENKLANLT
ncbi:MAG: glutamate formimidoyltransferase [Patescibacteria group bacterium]